MFPHSSKRKIDSTVWMLNSNIYRIFCKGEPETLIDKCTNFLNKKGQLVKYLYIFI